MSSVLVGKSIQCINLHTSNNGYYSNSTVITTKQNDVNSRFVKIKLFDGNKQVECNECSVIANYTLPGGDKRSYPGELIDSDILIKIPKEVLAEEGKIEADVSVIKRIDEIVVSTGKSYGITNAEVEDSEKFIDKVGTVGGLYTFNYNGSAWKINEETVQLNTYGIKIYGTPKIGDVVYVDYSDIAVLTSETFYIINQEAQNQDTLTMADNSLSLMANDVEYTILKEEEYIIPSGTTEFDINMNMSQFEYTIYFNIGLNTPVGALVIYSKSGTGIRGTECWGEQTYANDTTLTAARINSSGVNITSSYSTSANDEWRGKVEYIPISTDAGCSRISIESGRTNYNNASLLHAIYNSRYFNGGDGIKFKMRTSGSFGGRVRVIARKLKR